MCVSITRSIVSPCSAVSFGQVHIDVAARVHNDGPAGGLIPNQVRPRVQAVQIVLREDHRFAAPNSLVTVALLKTFPGAGVDSNLKSP